MKAVILAGGRGTRLFEETVSKPKPLVEIGGRPILWHIMKIYSTHGINDFVICSGYKGEKILEYFANYPMHNSDVTFDLSTNSVEIHDRRAEPWRVTVVNTGDDTETGGRLKRVRAHLAAERDFCFTYGDGVADIDVSASIAFHRSHGRLVTVAAVLPPGRFGSLARDGDVVTELLEKPRGDVGWINGGFFVMSVGAIDWIDGDRTSWEVETVPKLATSGELRAFDHLGFWQPMDTMRDKLRLEQMWQSGSAPWKIW